MFIPDFVLEHIFDFLLHFGSHHAMMVLEHLFFSVNET